MKKIVLLVVGLTVQVTEGLCQLPATSVSTAKVSATVLSIVDEKSGKLTNLYAFGYQKKISERWKYNAEISMMDRINPHAVPLVSRGHHVSTQQSLTAKVNEWSSVMVSSFTSMDKELTKPVTQVWIITTNFKLPNEATLLTSIENRRDHVEDEFTITDGAVVNPKQYQFQTVTIHYIGSTKKKAVLNSEVIAGHYYGLNRAALRVGGRYRFFHGLSFFSDAELNAVSGDKTSCGALVRLVTDLQFTRNFSMNIFSIHNTYNQLSAIMGSIQYTNGNHTVKAEYRNLMDNSLHSIETSNPWFSSMVLLQYRFTPFLKA